MIAESRAHLRAGGESYWQHWRFATTVGALAIAAGLACLVHAVVPALCTGTASRTIRRLTWLFDHRDAVDQVGDEACEAIAFALMLVLGAGIVAPLWLMHAPALIRWLYSGFVFAVPLTLLLTNRELERTVAQPHAAARTPALAALA